MKKAEERTETLQREKSYIEAQNMAFNLHLPALVLLIKQVFAFFLKNIVLYFKSILNDQGSIS